MDGGTLVAVATPTSRDVTFSFPARTIAVGATTYLYIVGDFSGTSGDTFGIRLPSTHPFGLGAAVVAVRENAGARTLGYIGAVPSAPQVDGAFDEWTALSADGSTDVAPRPNPDIDVARYGAQPGGTSTFLYTAVLGRGLRGTPVPETPQPVPLQNTSAPADTDRDTVPDVVDPMPLDFNNDGIPDAQTNGDYDGDGITDFGFPGGTDYWLNTTLPGSFPAPYAGKFVSVYIGPTQKPVALGEDVLRIFLDIDNSTWSGYPIGGIGADRLVEIRGKDRAVTQSALLAFSGSFPGQWAWTPVSPVTVALGYHAVELSVPVNATKVYVEAGDFWGSVDSTAIDPVLALMVASFKMATASARLSVPWAQVGPQPAATVIDPGSGSATTVYNQQRKVVRAGDTPGTACDATNSDGCWYTVFYNQLAEQATTAPQSTKVQNGQATLAAGTSTLNVTITSVVMTKAFVTFSASFNDANPDFSQISGQIIDTTTLRFQRAKSVGAPSITIEWYVAEFNRGVVVQRNSTTMTGNTVNVPISSVVLTESFPIVTYRKSGTGYGSDDFLRAKITTSTNLQLSLFNITVFDGVAEWQVIEYTDASVQTGDVTFNSDFSKMVTIPTVDETEAWLLFTYTSDNGTAFNIGPKMVRGLIMTPTTLVFDRNFTNAMLSLTWYLVVFTDTTSVQSWRVYFATGQTQKDISIECVDPTKTIVTAGGMYYRGGRTWYGSDDNPGVATVTLDLTTSTNLRLVRGASPNDADIGWYVVEFGTGCTVAGTFPNDIQTEDGVFVQYREANIGQTGADNNPTGVGTSPACAWTSCSNGEMSDDAYAVSPSDGQVVSYKTFGFNIPAGSTISPVRFGGEAFQTGAADERLDLMTLSWNSGTTYCGNTFLIIPVTVDPNGYTWFDQTTCTSHAWSASDFTGDLIAWKAVHTKNGGANPIDLDAMIVEVAYTPQRYKLAVQYDWSGVPGGADSYTLKVKGYRQDENLNVQVLTPPSTWNTRATISSTINTVYDYTLTTSEYNSGAPSVRFVDASGPDGTQSDFWLDLAVVTSTTLWDRIIMMRSLDTSGSTWGSQIVLASGRSADSPLLYSFDSTEPSIAIDSGGFLHLVWVSASASGSQQILNLVRYVVTTVAYPTQSQLASSASWTAVAPVDDTAPGYMPTISSDTSKNPHIAWSASKTSGTVYYKNKAAGTWRPTVSWGTTYTGLSVDVSPENNYVSLVRYYEAGTNEIQYTVCKNLGSNQCDAASEFMKADNSSGYDTVASGVEASSYPSLATTWDVAGDLWIAYAKDVDGSTRAIYVRFLDYPVGVFAAAEAVDSLSGTQFTHPSIGVDRTGNVYALYVAVSGSQLYYKSRTGGSWTSRTTLDAPADYPSVVVRAPNDVTFGTNISGALYWKSSTSATYFYYIPEFEDVIPPLLGAIFVSLALSRRSRREARSDSQS